jgi:hypothetical protein
VGLDKAKVLLSQDQVLAFRTGYTVDSESNMKGKRGAFLIQDSFSVPPGSEQSWYVVADINQGPSELTALLNAIRKGVSPAVLEADIDAGTQRLAQLVGGSDGCQLSSDALLAARHFSNTLFNIMRGGTFYDEYTFPLDDFLDFVTTWNRPLREKFKALFPTWNEWRWNTCR